MFAVLRPAEITVLAVSTLLAVWTLRDPRKVRALAAAAGAFALIYALKVALVPTVRYAGPDAGRAVYLVLLVVHAAGTPAAFALGAFAYVKKRPPRTFAWAWLVAAGAGVASFLVLALTGT